MTPVEAPFAFSSLFAVEDGNVPSLFHRHGDIEFWHNERLVPYPDALEAMTAYVAEKGKEGSLSDLFWFLSHPSLYTAGTSAKEHHLLDQRFPIYQTNRGGQHTYHGPGQRVIYGMVDLSFWQKDLRRYISFLEAWGVAVLEELGLKGFCCPERVGVWLKTPWGSEAKIAAVGIRIRRWITFHGLAFNVCPDLAHFSGIVPCGLEGFEVTSLHALGYPLSLEEVDALFLKTFPRTLSSFCPLHKDAVSS